MGSNHLVSKEFLSQVLQRRSAHFRLGSSHRLSAMPLTDSSTQDEVKKEIIKLVKDIGSVEVDEGDELEAKGVDSMDMSAIQQKVVEAAPTLSGKAGMDKDTLK